MKFLLFTTALAALSSSVFAAQSTKPKTTNKVQAASLQAAAVFLKPGSYKFTNVATKQTITYVPKGNHIYPAKAKKGLDVKMVATAYGKKVPWSRINFGKKNKCLSSAWTSNNNDAAVAYVCASGAKAKKTTLERTKQWWLFVPVSKPVVKASSNSYANTVLLAAQSDSIKTRNKKLADAAAAFDKRSLGQRSVAHSRMARVVKRNSIEKRATKAAGTYYIIATDHLIDMPARALTGKIFKSRGITSTQLKIWKKGQKNQQWRVTKA